ncbi:MULTISPECIES: hypothetical protein [unclassified Rhizobium]|uniref:hypothetical protein n=1 Tax=unclassified Rhizobium TaxID=2613769 RepID=UPI00190FD4C1|nr:MULTISPECIES: hypothetical protein [unclassified Rhizobium]
MIDIVQGLDPATGLETHTPKSTEQSIKPLVQPAAARGDQDAFYSYPNPQGATHASMPSVPFALRDVPGQEGQLHQGRPHGVIVSTANGGMRRSSGILLKPHKEPNNVQRKQ